MTWVQHFAETIEICSDMEKPSSSYNVVTVKVPLNHANKMYSIWNC